MMPLHVENLSRYRKAVNSGAPKSVQRLLCSLKMIVVRDGGVGSEVVDIDRMPGLLRRPGSREGYG